MFLQFIHYIFTVYNKCSTCTCIYFCLKFLNYFEKIKLSILELFSFQHLCILLYFYQGELQRKIGVKVSELGGNAVIG